MISKETSDKDCKTLSERSNIIVILKILEQNKYIIFLPSLLWCGIFYISAYLKEDTILHHLRVGTSWSRCRSLL